MLRHLLQSTSPICFFVHPLAVGEPLVQKLAHSRSAVGVRGLLDEERKACCHRPDLIREGIQTESGEPALSTVIELFFYDPGHYRTGTAPSGGAALNAAAIRWGTLPNESGKFRSNRSTIGVTSETSEPSQ